MDGQIFICYRREDSSGWAGRLYDHISAYFPQTQIFMDVDKLDPGVDFIESIETSVDSCEVLIAEMEARSPSSPPLSRSHDAVSVGDGFLG